MAAENGDRRGGMATLDGETGVDRIQKPRPVQDRGDCFATYLAKEYVRFLGVNKQGSSTQHCYIKGTHPVVIEEEAIVIRKHPNGGE